MKLMKFYFCSIFFVTCMWASAQSLSHQVLSNAGNTTITPQMRLSWTLGEIAVIRWEALNNTGILTEGFHQPSIQLDNNTVSGFDLVQILPNPVQNQLSLNVIANDDTRYLTNLQDAQGKVLVKNLNLKGKIELDMSNYPAGVYFLSIHSLGGTLLQNHKIVKL